MILFVYGVDNFRIREKTSELIQQFRQKRDSTGMNIVMLSGDELGIDRVRQEVMTQGFLTDKKMIVISQALSGGNDELHEGLLKFFDSYETASNNQNVVVCTEVLTPDAALLHPGKAKASSSQRALFEFLKKQKFVFEFEVLSPRQLEQWAQARVVIYEGIFDQDALTELVQRVGPDLWRMSNEIHKLVMLKKPDSVSRDDVIDCVYGKFEENIFALTDSIAERHTSRALHLLSEEIENGANELFVLSMVVRQFRILLQLKDFSSRGVGDSQTLAQSLKLHPYVVKKTLPLVKKYSLSQLHETYNKLLYIDEQIKSGHPNPLLLLGMFIVGG